jgi:hypothetical protein
VDGTATDAPPRILAVADGWPWPAGPARAARILDGLAAAGEVDLCVLVPSPGPPPAEAAAALRRSCRDHATVVVGTPARLDRVFDGGHDQVWYLTPRALRLVGRRPASRIVVDLGGVVDPTRAELRRVRRDADLVLTLPSDDALARTVAALARTGAVPPARRPSAPDLRVEGLVA